MWQIDRRLLYVAIAVGLVAIAVLSITYANDWVLSGLATLSIGCWLTGVLWTVYAPPKDRAFPLGALAASFIYVLLACGPWFQSNVGPWLLTTRALVTIDTHLLGREQPQVAYQEVPLSTIYSNNLSNTLSFPPNNLWTTARMPASASAVTPSVAIGHWLFAWCAAAIGGFAARWMVRRQQRTASSGGSPFAEAAR